MADHVSSGGAMNEVLAYYASGVEETRLRRGIGQIEFARTKEILRRHLPAPPAVIYDVGGATGAYSYWLAQMGFAVHLLELSPENLAQACSASESQAAYPLASIEVADARALPRPDNSADALLLMGPLYHLTERRQRLQALAEAHRVLKPRGSLAAAAITRFGSVLYGLSTYGQANWLMDEPGFMDMLRRELQDGQHIPPERYSGLFTRAYFHLPRELKEEIEEAGFIGASILAVEGPGWLVPRLDEIWRDEGRREQVLKVVRALEDEASIQGASPHLLGIAWKPA